MSSWAGWEGFWFIESTNWLFTVRLCDRTSSYLGDLNTPVQQPLSPNVVPVVSNVVQQAAVLHQLSHELDRRRQADPQQTTHMRVIHARHHIRLLHTHTNTCVSVETCPIKEATNNKRRRNSNNKLKEMKETREDESKTLTSKISLLALGDVASRRTLMATGILTFSPSGIHRP